jgi:hypothetical protein
MLIDRFSRSGATASPFPELRQAAPAEPSTTVAPTDAPPSATKQGGAAPIDSGGEVQLPISTPTTQDAVEPLPLREAWDLSALLWDSVANWPSTPGAAQTPADDPPGASVELGGSPNPPPQVDEAPNPPGNGLSSAGPSEPETAGDGQSAPRKKPVK